MKCDVCGTKIPLGSHECPKCGYKIPTSHATYDAKSPTHEHIKPKTKFQKPKKDLSQYHLPQHNMTIKIILIVLIVICLLGTFIPIVHTRYSISENYSNIMTIQEAIDNNYDDGTLTMALEYKNDIQDLMQNTFALEDITESEEVSFDYGVYAHFMLYGYKNDGSYTVSVTFENNELFYATLSIYNQADVSIRSSNVLEQEKEFVNLMSQQFGVESVFDSLQEATHQMIEDPDEENHWYFDYRDNSPFYISERYDDYLDCYYYYLSLDL